MKLKFYYVHNYWMHFFPRSLELYDRKQCFRGHLWRKNKSFQKKPMFLVVEKSQIESSWMVLTAESWEHSGKFCQNIIIFWQNISLCSQISAVSTIQLGLNLAYFGQLKTWAFFEKICFSATKDLWSTVSCQIIPATLGKSVQPRNRSFETDNAWTG